MYTLCAGADPGISMGGAHFCFGIGAPFERPPRKNSVLQHHFSFLFGVFGVVESDFDTYNTVQVIFELKCDYSGGM